MIKARTLLFTGIWVILLPHLGLPNFIKNILFAITGFLIIYTSYIMYKQILKEKKYHDKFENFSENREFIEEAEEEFEEAYHHEPKEGLVGEADSEDQEIIEEEIFIIEEKEN